MRLHGNEPVRIMTLALKFADVADIILLYPKSTSANFNAQYTSHDPEYIKKFYRYDDHDGRGPYRLGDMASPNPRPNMMYEWMGYSYPQRDGDYEQENDATAHNEGRIYYPKKPDGSPISVNDLL